MSVKPTVNKPLPRLRAIFGLIKRSCNGFDAIRERCAALLSLSQSEHVRWNCCVRRRFDPSVLAIKINIYRVAKDSRIIDSMIHAAHNGKSHRGGGVAGALR